MRKLILICLFSILLIGLAKATYICPEPIELHQGWNSFALYPNSTERLQTGDRNISIVVGYNLIGHSGINPVAVKDLIFTNSSGYVYTWNQAHNLGIINISYAKNLSLFMVKTPINLYSSEAYWVYANQAGNLTLPSIGGSLSGGSYAWSKLRFVNGSDEKSIQEIQAMPVAQMWIETTLQYYGYIGLDALNLPMYGFKFINDEYPAYEDPIEPIGKSTIFSNEGIFIKSKVDNLTLIRQNSTCPYTLTIRYKSNNYTIEESDTLHLSLKGKDFVVEADNKITLRMFLSHIARWVGRYI